MKNIILISLFLLLASCGGNDTSEESTPSVEKSGGEATVQEASSSNVPEAPKAVKFCKPCHNFNQGERNKLGPNLFGRVGRRAGKVDGYRFSKYFKKANWFWTRENLKLFISKSTGTPNDAIRKLTGNEKALTTMIFRGVSDEEADIIIDYMEKLK